MSNKYLPPRKAREQLGVSNFSLKQWAEKGLINYVKTPGGKRLYDVSSFVKEQSNIQSSKKKICYCRVSSASQKDDLQRQIAFMQSEFPEHQIITDIASGINFKRKGLITILELCCRGELQEIVVAYRDRLCRFAFELFEWLFREYGVKLVVLNSKVEAESSKESELADDLLSIIQVFNCRVNGRRKYTKRSQESQPGTENKKDI